MPIFEYECAKCKETFELLISSGSSDQVKCPACSSKKVHRLFSCFSLGAGKSEKAGSSGASSACSTCASKNCSSCG